MEHNSIYTSNVIRQLELGWGEGWLSPGGARDLAVLLAGVDIADKTVLDIGVGAGGPAMLLVSKFRAGHVTGIDVDPPVLERAHGLIASSGLEDRIDLQCVTPGRLPFADASFDVVFSKDAFVHIAEKALLFSEIHRVLAPGGWCVFSDWCCSDPPYSAEMQAFLGNGMSFTMVTPAETRELLERAGFENIAVRDRNTWFAELAVREAGDTACFGRVRLVRALGAEAAERSIAAARRRAVIADQGHLRPAHFCGRKPER